MSNLAGGKGACLCGAVCFSAKSMGKEVVACHCSMCRKWGGGPFIEVDCGADVDFEGADSISLFSSSDWTERGFCNRCGTHLFYRLKQTQQHIMPVGLFDSDDGFEFKRQVFIDEKPLYYSFENKTETMTGVEVFAKFAPPAE